MPVQQNPSGGGFIEAGDQLGESGFAHPGRADQRQHFSGFAYKGDILQHRNAFSIGKAHMIEGNLSLNILKGFSIPAVPDLGRCIQHIQYALSAGH